MEAHLSALKPLDLRAAALKPLDTKHAAPPSPPKNDDRRPPAELHLALGNMNRLIDDDGALVVNRVGPPQPQYTVSTHITVVRQSDQQKCAGGCTHHTGARDDGAVSMTHHGQHGLGRSVHAQMQQGAVRRPRLRGKRLPALGAASSLRHSAPLPRLYGLSDARRARAERCSGNSLGLGSGPGPCERAADESSRLPILPVITSLAGRKGRQQAVTDADQESGAAAAAANGHGTERVGDAAVGRAQKRPRPVAHAHAATTSGAYSPHELDVALEREFELEQGRRGHKLHKLRRGQELGRRRKWPVRVSPSSSPGPIAGPGTDAGAHGAGGAVDALHHAPHLLPPPGHLRAVDSTLVVPPSSLTLVPLNNPLPAASALPSPSSPPPLSPCETEVAARQMHTIKVSALTCLSPDISRALPPALDSNVIDVHRGALGAMATRNSNDSTTANTVQMLKLQRVQGQLQKAQQRHGRSVKRSEWLERYDASRSTTLSSFSHNPFVHGDHSAHDQLAKDLLRRFQCPVAGD